MNARHPVDSLRQTQKLEPRWRFLYEADFNGGGGNGDNKDCVATPRQQCAAALAGSWKALYRARLEKDREVDFPNCNKTSLQL